MEIYVYLRGERNYSENKLYKLMDSLESTYGLVTMTVPT